MDIGARMWSESLSTMIAFQIYKIFHIISVFVFLTATSVAFFVPSDSGGRLIGFRILSILSGFAIFFTGLGLLLAMTAGFPLWAILKGFIWLALVGFSAVALKYFTHFLVLAYLFLILLASLAIYFAVYKPV